MARLEIPGLAELVKEAVREALAEQRPEPEGWLTLEGAAEYTGLTYEAVKSLVRRKELPAYRPNGRTFLRRADIDAWIERGGEA